MHSMLSYYYLHIQIPEELEFQSTSLYSARFGPVICSIHVLVLLNGINNNYVF